MEIRNATLRSFPARRQPDEREDAGIEAMLRGGGLRRRQDFVVQRQRRIRRAHGIGAGVGTPDRSSNGEATGTHVLYTIVRSANTLRERIAADPYAAFRVPANAKRVVTFLREPLAAPSALPVETEGVRILAVDDTDIFTVYVPQPGNPAFMRLIEKTFGANVTTRTWDTVKKCAAA